MTVLAVDTPHGRAAVHLQPVDDPIAALVLGHGAGGGVSAKDIEAAARAARAEGLGVALVEQPYRVAGRRSPAPAAHLDAAWVSVVSQLPVEGLPLLVGGRSAGASPWRPRITPTNIPDQAGRRRGEGRVRPLARRRVVIVLAGR